MREEKECAIKESVHMESALSRYGGSEKPIMKLKAFFTICFIVSDIYVYTQFHMVA